MRVREERGESFNSLYQGIQYRVLYELPHTFWKEIQTRKCSDFRFLMCVVRCVFVH
jgi:hypothetical protein